jgi:quinolinate synthase
MIVATEPHIMHQMEKGGAAQDLHRRAGADGNCNCNMCPYMALNTMEKLYVALRDSSRGSRWTRSFVSRQEVARPDARHGGRTVGQAMLEGGSRQRLI